jgi:hypothetical protein
MMDAIQSVRKHCGWSLVIDKLSKSAALARFLTPLSTTLCGEADNQLSIVSPDNSTYMKAENTSNCEQLLLNRWFDF